MSRTILITGASSGIGKALASHYATAGNRLVLWGRNKERLAEVARSCAQSAGHVESEAFDLSAPEGDFEGKLSSLDNRAPVELAIFNAGIGGSLPRDALTQSPAATREMVDVNLTIPIIGANILAPRMAARGHGQIVFLGSIAGNFPLPMAPAYAASKAALALFAEALRLRVMRSGVCVTLVAPGFVDTPMSQALKEPRPFLISAESSARIIANGIERRRREVVLPWQFAALRRAASFVPRALIRSVLARI